MLDVAPRETVKDVMWMIQRCSADGVYIAFQDRVLREWRVVNDSGVVSGSTMFVGERLRGGGVHKSKRQMKQKKIEDVEQHEQKRRAQVQQPSEDITRSDKDKQESELERSYDRSRRVRRTLCSNSFMSEE